MIIKVKKRENKFLVEFENSNSLIVPKDKKNRHYKSILQWIKNGGIIEDEDLQNKLIEKRIKINNDCNNTIIGGFYSSVLGKKNFYYSTIAEQINFQTYKLQNKEAFIKCQELIVNQDKTESFGLRQRKKHTVIQIEQLLNDCNNHIQQQINKKDNLREQINLAQDIEQIKKIVW